jgi:hypothetical protein
MKGLTRDEIDEVVAGPNYRPRDRRDREFKRGAEERVAAKREADREDRSLQERLDDVTATRDRALERITRYDEAIDAAVGRLGESHEVSRLLRAAQETTGR